MPGVRPMKEGMPVNKHDEYVERFESPDGSFVIEVMSEEVRMSHWINYFRIVKNGGGVVVWEPARSWSLESHTWLNGNEVELVLRKYPDSQYLTVRIDCIGRTAQFNNAVFPLATLETVMNLET